MRMKVVWSLLVSLACMCTAANVLAKADTVGDGFYTEKDKEYYLSPEQMLFIRPGLEVEILDVVVPADGQMVVTYSISDPAGLPLDHEGIYTPGEVDMRFTLANIPMGEEHKVRLAYERTSRNGVLEKVCDGTYKYKFDYVMDSDPDTTHTLVLGFRRDLREWGLDRYSDNAIQNWVPSGMYDPVARDIVTTETCNRCHGELGEHGDRWQSPQACTNCHNPSQNTRFDALIHAVHAGQEIENASGSRTYDFSWVHYPAQINDCEVCHTGGTPTENFPLVASPASADVCDQSGLGMTTLHWGGLDRFEIRMGSADGPVFVDAEGMGSAETGQWVSDGTVFFLVDKASGETIQELTVNTTHLGCVGNQPGTFRGEAGLQHTNWLDHPSRVVCGSCHTNIDFENGVGHPAQTNDDRCGICHKPTGGEFDASIAGAHLPVYKSSQLPGIVVDILDVSNTAPGENPTVTFSLTDKHGVYNPAGLAFFNLVIAGPNEDFDFLASERATSASPVEGGFSYTFNTAIPDDASGSFTIGAEIFQMVPVDMGGDEPTMFRHTAENPVYTFAVTDSAPVPRRMIVDDAKCENCHSNLQLHGTIRHEPQYCVTCHAPASTDWEELQEGATEQSIHFKYMIHSIHMGAERAKPYIAAGHNQSVHDYGEVHYPGNLANCDDCHVNDSQQLSLPAGLLPTTTPQEWWSPMQPITAACTSCHNDDSTAVHAYINMTFFGESCATCHGEGKEFSVNEVHAQ